MDDTLMPNSPRQHARPSTRSDRPSTPAADGVPAICRICRGEATETEPLFYPCKCSGSIKFVHQECLMEWLSHSQKKYCELCKTSFRFTKLYAPDMPQSLPVHVFLEHMAKYLFRNLLVWLRAVLAVSIWICWLPLFMRAVWSFMFWISDEGLGGSLASLRNSQAAWVSNLYTQITGQCRASPLVQKTTTSLAEAAAMLKHLPGAASGIPKFAVKSIAYGSNLGNGTGSYKSYTDENGTVTLLYEIDSPSASLLSNVTFLRNLTQSPRLNRAVMSIVEGQIITILVIVCFILIILVRDYVVQQQPELNMRAAFADQEDDQVDAFDHHEHAHADHDHAVAHEFDHNFDPPQYNQPNNPHLFDADEQAAVNDVWRMAMDPDVYYPDGTAEEVEQARAMEYLEVYRRARGDHMEILRIIDRENLGRRLGSWEEATRRVLIRDGVDAATLHYEAQRAARVIDREGRNIQGRDREERNHDFAPGTPPLFAQDFPAVNHNHATGRPRATSDGPSNLPSINPLANNSWTFEGLPVDEQGESSTRQPAQPTNPDVEGIFGNYMEEDAGVDATSTAFAEPHPRPVNRMMQRRPFEQDSDDNVDPEPETSAEQPQAENPAGQDVAPIANNQDEQLGLVGRMADFMWGDLDHHGDELALQAAQEQDADDDAWVDVVDGDVADDQAADDPMQGANALDQDAIDDMEDFEGVMELVGMRGPIAGLFQNAIFCAVLVSVTIFACIFVPYNIGRVTVWLMASPMRLIRMIVEISKLIQDALVLACGFVAWCAVNLFDLFVSMVMPPSIYEKILWARKACWDLWVNAGTRIFDYLFMDFPMSATEIQNFSAISHGALLSLKARAAESLEAVQQFGMTVYTNGTSLPSTEDLAVVGTKVKEAGQYVAASSSLLLTPDAWVINLGDSKAVEEVDPELARWSGTDRFWAILAGYAAVFTVAAMYLQRNAPFSTGQFMRAWEAGVIDTLHQASGIMKVILIISIEMLVFPLYCGMLLDLALLPLFENTTVLSRFVFTRDYPATSIFVHWFVGTGYMFHFALFVSMCRKIMRPGVLYFIRDPDDPEFHPVRDVLERNLITQLRKILFSAFVYGALVVVCLGGVVWGLSLTLPSVLPIHYSSNEPVLEFPVDLLFYNFLMPLAVKFFKPGDGIHAMYTWWFRRCARALRLTSFLFGDRKVDEEGTLELPEHYKATRSFFQQLFLGVDQNNNTVVKSWQEALTGDVDVETDKVEPDTAKAHKEHLVQSKQLLVNGRFVRAPASDRVKIAKGRKVFVTVDEDNQREDGNEDDDLYASDQYRSVYVPPSFRSRIFLFILFIWFFAAFTGVSLTIVPLVVGRMMFKALIPDYVRTNDIYAFSIGIYVLGAASYLVVHSRSVLDKVQRRAASVREEIAAKRAASRALSALFHGLQLAYTYFFLAIVFPLLVSLVVELYIAIPLHTYMNPPTAATIEADKVDHVSQGRHTVRLTQVWTLGLLYIKLGSKMITTLFPETRAAVAVRTVLRRGWQRPDVGVFTRAFVIPGVAIAVLAISAPPFVAKLLVEHEVFSFLPQAGETAADVARLAIFYRYSYPGAAALLVMVKNAMALANVFNKWTAGVRDETYLIGERLHNFGAANAGARKGRGAWRAAANRL